MFDSLFGRSTRGEDLKALEASLLQRIQAAERLAQSAVNTVDERVRDLNTVIRSYEGTSQTLAQQSHTIAGLKQTLQAMLKRVEELETNLGAIEIGQAAAAAEAKGLKDAQEVLRSQMATLTGQVRDINPPPPPDPGVWRTPKAIGQEYLRQNPNSAYNPAGLPGRVGQGATTLKLRRSPYYRTHRVPSDPERLIQEYNEEAARLIMSWLMKNDKGLELTQLAELQQAAIPETSQSLGVDSPNFPFGEVGPTGSSLSHWNPM